HPAAVKRRATFMQRTQAQQLTPACLGCRSQIRGLRCVSAPALAAEFFDSLREEPRRMLESAAALVQACHAPVPDGLPCLAQRQTGVIHPLPCLARRHYPTGPLSPTPALSISRISARPASPAFT